MEQQSPLAPLPIKESFQEGWRLFKGNFAFLVGVFAFMFLINMFFGGVEEAAKGRVGLSFVAQVMSYAVMVFLQLGFITITLSLVDGKEARWNDLFSQSGLILAYTFASILYGIGAVVGLVLLVVPGVIFLLTYQFYAFSLVDHRLGILESLRQSAALSRGYRWSLLKFALLSALINFGGLLAVGLGLFVTIPVTGLAHVYVYRFLSKRFVPQEEKSEAVAEPLTAPQVKPQTLTSEEEA